MTGDITCACIYIQIGSETSATPRYNGNRKKRCSKCVGSTIYVGSGFHCSSALLLFGLNDLFHKKWVYRSVLAVAFSELWFKFKCFYSREKMREVLLPRNQHGEWEARNNTHPSMKTNFFDIRFLSDILSNSSYLYFCSVCSIPLQTFFYYKFMYRFFLYIDTYAKWS